MMRPPAFGPHGRHRTLGTPGPTGYNDHGDPGHLRRRGRTPGPLGHNDHGAPLPGKTLSREVDDDDIARVINDIIDHVNRVTRSEPLDERLRLCLELAQRSRVEQGDGDQKYRAVEWYFRARLQALEGGAEVADHFADGSAAATHHILNLGWVWAGSMPSAAAQPKHHRLGLGTARVSDQQLPGPHESAVDWAINGAADRLRDALGDRDLRAHVRPLTTDRGMVAFPRTLTD